MIIQDGDGTDKYAHALYNASKKAVASCVTIAGPTGLELPRPACNKEDMIRTEPILRVLKVSEKPRESQKMEDTEHSHIEAGE